FYNASQVHETVTSDGNKVRVAIDSGQPVEWTTEDNYKFTLSKFQIIVPSNRYNEVRSLIKTDISDLSISRPRSRLNWGVDVPGDDEQIIYVWLDALISYLTVGGYPWDTKGEHGKESFTGRKPNAWPADIHIVGKDIIKFHTILWISFLMAAKLPLPKKILAHSHWTLEKHKMSKSRGNVICPFKLMNHYGVDAVRYYLLRDGGIADDGAYSEHIIGGRYRKDLAGQIGNLISRSTSHSLNPSSIVPKSPLLDGNLKENEVALMNILTNLPNLVDKHFEKFEFSKGLGLIFDAIAEVNKYFTDCEPWKLVSSPHARTPENEELLNRTLFFSAETLRIAGILLQSVMPTKMSELLDNLSVGKDERKWSDAKLGNGWPTMKDGKIVKFDVKGQLFPKLKD
ncbi:223_t:CDS:2, partial [Acaulospora morrowiae]